MTYRPGSPWRSTEPSTGRVGTADSAFLTSDSRADVFLYRVFAASFAATYGRR